MAEQTKKAPVKKPLTPRQAEIVRLREKGKAKRSDQESAKLDQLVSEERRERFLRLAPKRVSNVLEGLRRLAACGNRASYQYTEEEVVKIKATIVGALAEVESAFSERKREREQFRL